MNQASDDGGATAELFRALGECLALPDSHLGPIAAALELGPLPSRAEHADLFTLQLVPYASVYLGNSGHIGGEARERIAGFWRALEADVPGEPDHLRELLALYAALMFESPTSDANRARLRHWRRALLGEHLLSWLPLYLLKLRQQTEAPFYRAWSELLESALEREAVHLKPPPIDSSHWMKAVPPPTPLDVDELVSLLLAPVRSGLILTRRDLVDAGRTLRVATRIGERRFMLEAMLRQRPREVLEWLMASLDDAVRAYSEAPRYASPLFQRAIGLTERVRSGVGGLLIAPG